MAEKEEFIFVLPVEESNELRNITPYCNGCTFWPCDEECINRKKPILRQEAIEKMAKAFFKSWYGEGFEQEHPDLKRRYRESAEAALNALLEDK